MWKIMKIVKIMKILKNVKKGSFCSFSRWVKVLRFLPKNTLMGQTLGLGHPIKSARFACKVHQNAV